jgi:hypothetical protein
LDGSGRFGAVVSRAGRVTVYEIVGGAGFRKL